MSGMDMAMYFNARFDKIYVLFQAWFPTTPAAFALSCVAVAVLAAAEEVLKKTNARVSVRLAARGGNVLYRNVIRALLTFVHSTLSYGLMLIAMSFNVYIFFSMMCGFAIGTLCTGHWNERRAQVLVNDNSPATAVNIGDANKPIVQPLVSETNPAAAAAVTVRSVLQQPLLEDATEESDCCR